MNSIELKEKSLGFTKRDLHSKAILNTDKNSLLKYCIQKQKHEREKQTSHDVNFMKNEILELKQDLIEIRSLLLKITNKE
jgi:hypothetical protein